MPFKIDKLGNKTWICPTEQDYTEYKEKMAAVYADPVRNANISKNNKGKFGAATGKAWYNDGVEEKYFVVDQQPKGFARGRLTRK